MSSSSAMIQRNRLSGAAFLIIFLTFIFCGPASADGWTHLGAVQKVSRISDGLELTAGAAKIRITAFREGIFRVRVAPRGTFPKDYSWAVIAGQNTPPLKIAESAAAIKLTSGSITVIVNKSPLLITFADAEGHVILADEPTLPMAWDGSRIRAWKTMPPDENYYGLGDKPGPLNRRGRAFTNWNTDAYGFGESTDPIYKTVPFFVGLRKGIAYGLFFDNTWRTSFDFGKGSPDYFSFGSEGGELNYYFLAGPDPKKVVEIYTAIVGRSPLPPLWSLGFQQSRYSYETEARVREIARTFREKKIPADTIYLDIDYQQGLAPFTVNRQTFPHFESMIADLRAMGFRVITITDLHIKHDPGHGYAPYDSGAKDDVFVKNPDGTTYIGDVWPGPSVFPDFTLSRVRDWWGTLYKDFVSAGVSGFWNDMNEPSIFGRADKTMPLDVVHRLDDGTTLDHRAVHNIFGMENVRATYDGLRKLQVNERPFVLTRALYSGAQRYAATWTGDNSSTWNHLAMSTPMLMNLGLSGIPLVGDDIGGFVGSPTMDLLTRWIELGAFNPIFRDHTGKGSADQEPWVGGSKHEAIRRRYIELRYRLLPYIYSGIEESTRTGLPFMRPVFLDYPQADNFYGDDRDFLWGHDFFVAPVNTEMVDATSITLPPGSWYDFWTSQKLSSSDKITLHPALGEMPLYVRAGAIIPMQPLVQSTAETPPGPLQLHVYPGDNCRGSLYQDDGHTFDYQHGNFLRMNYSCAMSPRSLSVTAVLETSAFQPWWDACEVTVVGSAEPREVTVAGHPVHTWHYDRQTHSLAVLVPDARTNWKLELSY